MTTRTRSTGGHPINVSRTAVLRTPRLPPHLSIVVSIAHLRCRLLDTIEDDPKLEDALRQGRFSSYLLMDSPNTSDINARLHWYIQRHLHREPRSRSA